MEDILLTRKSESVPWGIRIQGGADFGQQLSVLKVEPNSLASCAVLNPGDSIVAINTLSTSGLTHQACLSLIRQSGNQLRLQVIRTGQQLPNITGSISSPTTSHPFNQAAENSHQYRAVLQPSFELYVQEAQRKNKGIASSASGGLPEAQDRKQSVSQSADDSNTGRIYETTGSSQQLQESIFSPTDQPKPQTFQPSFAQSSTHLQQISSQSNLQNDFLNYQSSDMAFNNGNQRDKEHIPSQLVNQFSRQNSQDKPFSYIPSSGMNELLQRQRSVPASPTRPKPTQLERQSSYNQSQASTPSYDPESLFTPAYREMLKQQRETLLNSSTGPLPAQLVTSRPDLVPQEEVAAYILQPDGSMVAVRPQTDKSRWNDKPAANLKNSAVMAALMEEQNGKQHGYSSGRSNSTGQTKQGLSFKVLQWLTGTDSDDNNSETASNYSGSIDGSHPVSKPRLRSQDVKIKEESPSNSTGRGSQTRVIRNANQGQGPGIEENTAFSDL